MFVIREPRVDDVPQILAVAKHLDTVNLPANRGHISDIVECSISSFSNELPASEREYLFVLEDIERDIIIGTSMIHAQHGTRRAPHIFFNVLKEERYSQTLDRYFVHECLRLGYNYDGPTEIGGLILLPDYRRHKAALGKLLSYTRFLYIAMHRETFRDEVISELLPPLEPDGTSVLWQHLGKKFTGLTYQEADHASKNNKEFIRALFPHGLIYTSLFPDNVREIVGRVGRETLGVEKILRRIGFEYANQIDPFDGGPHFKAKTDDITIVRDAREYQVDTIGSADDSRPWAIVATEHNGFRATGTRAILQGAGVLGLTPDVQELLAAPPKETIWSVLA